MHEIQLLKNKYTDGKALFKLLKPSLQWSDEFHRAIRYYILNRITYSGAVDSGGYSDESFKKRFTQSSIDRLKPLSELLQDVQITNEDYQELLFKEGRNVFIYMDPPYFQSMKNGLYGLNGNLHRNFDHQGFAENVRACNHKWLITLDNSDEIRKMFAFAGYSKRWTLYYGMTNAGNNIPSKGKELLISNYPLKKRYVLKP